MSLVCTKVDKLVHFLSVVTDRIYLHDQSCVTHWYLLTSSLSLELSLNTFSEPSLTTLLLFLLLTQSVGLINCFNYYKTVSTIVYNINSLIFTIKEPCILTYLLDYMKVVYLDFYINGSTTDSLYVKCDTHDFLVKYYF